MPYCDRRIIVPTGFLFSEKIRNYEPRHLSDFIRPLQQVSHAMARLRSIMIQPSGARPSAPRALTIAISANFLATPLRGPLLHWFERLTIASTPIFAPYDSIVQQLLDQNGAFCGADLAVILLRLENWCRRGNAISAESAHRNVDIFLRSIEAAARRQPGLILLTILCPSSPAFRFDTTLVTAAARLKEACKTFPNVYVVGESDLDLYYPVSDYNVYFVRETGNDTELHFTELCYATLSTIIARRISALFMDPRKVIAIDCDNTLWLGICGEEGSLGVSVGPGHRRLQQALLEQWERGRLLCVCSKNNEADALAVFDQNPDMLIKRKHLSAIRANWNPKAENLRSLAAELRLGLDSFIFIDDDPFECESVTMLCPEVRTVRMVCTDDATVSRTLLQVWELDTTLVTEEDRQRASYYSQESERDRARESALSLDEFLEHLDLQVVVRALARDSIPRAAQLTHRVNQFNLNGIRLSPAELQARIDVATCLLVSVSDRFGDYGVVGLIICDVSERSLRVETLVLSCRVLGRGVEHRLGAYIAETARSCGRSHIEFEFLPTQKNIPLQKFLENIGCKDDTSGRRMVHVEELMRTLSANRGAGSGH